MLEINNFIKNNWQYALFVFVCLFIYEGVYYFDFVNFDDQLQVTDNIRIQRLSLEHIKVLFTTATASMYQPLTSLILAVIFYFAEYTAGYYHLFSLGIHLFNGVLVYHIVLILFKNKTTAVMLPLLFLMHPIMVESVLWVSATSTVLYSFFFLLTTLTYLQYCQSNKKNQYFFTLLFFILGLLCKIQMITFVGILFIIDWYFKDKKNDITQFIKKIPFIIIAILFICIGLNFRSTEQDSLTGISYDLLWIAPTQFGWYISKYLVPFSLSIVYDWPITISMKEYFFSFLFLVSIGLLIRFRKNKLVVFGLIFYLITIGLHTTFIIRFFSPYADRYAYLPYVGFLIFLFALASRIKKEHVLLVSFVGLIFYSYSSKKQIKVWENSETLWTHNLKSQKTVIANINRATNLIEQKKYKKALIDVKIILQSKDRTLTEKEKSSAYYFLGIIHQNQNKFDKSEKSYLKSIAMNAKRYEAFYNLGNLYAEQQRYNRAIEMYTKGIEIMPNFLSLYKNRANAYYQREQYKEALKDVDKASALDLKKPTIQKRDNSLNEFKKAILKKLQTN
jgi:Tfp pilus assembly protein PilF